MDTQAEYALEYMMKQVYEVVDSGTPPRCFIPSDTFRLNTPQAFQPGSWIPLAKEGGLTEEQIMEIINRPV